MFADDPLADDAAQVCARDITEVMADLGLFRHPCRALRVAHHSACSLQHGQQIRATPKDLLAAAGFGAGARDSHLCCGPAGTYNLMQPAIRRIEAPQGRHA